MGQGAESGRRRPQTAGFSLQTKSKSKSRIENRFTREKRRPQTAGFSLQTKSIKKFISQSTQFWLD